MGEQTKLSKLLREQGYKNVLVTNESHAGGVTRVKHGQPFTWDYNNGVTVVYDENGSPWIRHGNLSLDGLKPELLERGAHVPHSNDGGYFVREVLPTL